jgi:hypothetical protein
MTLLMAIVRTVFLLFIVVYALVGTPVEILGRPETMVAVRAVRALVQITWIAIGWIALETAIGWVRVRLARRKASAGAAPATPAPPAARP